MPPISKRLVQSSRAIARVHQATILANIGSRATEGLAPDRSPESRAKIEAIERTGNNNTATGMTKLIGANQGIAVATSSGRNAKLPITNIRFKNDAEYFSKERVNSDATSPASANQIQGPTYGTPR